jgi:endonuclease YncB( thermonuclease family)
MRRAARYRRFRLTRHGWPWVIVLVLAAGVWIDAYGVPMPATDGVTILTPAQPSDRRIVSLPPQAGTLAVSPSDVIDGDTVRVRGESFRLVGFDTAETGAQARCAYERDLGDRATARLRELIGSAARSELTPVRCACRPGTHGTRDCNYGRSCGTLRADGRDVGRVLIAEGLARPYVCSATGCPRRGSWC